MKMLRLTEQQYAARQGATVLPYENEVQEAALTMVKLHHRVAWAARMNTGATKIGERFIRFGFPGLSDIIGQTTDGRFIAIECKREGEKPTEQQQAFLDTVAGNGGVSGCAHSAQEAWDILEMCKR